ncbi:MAG: DUF1905 domain-containing protein [Chloracidobacterium sp.]|nr:DUF1905 domain-containing protein [Chloracidobacterium sp.]
MKFKTELTRAMPESGWVFLVITPEIANKFPTDGKSRRVVCRINDGEPFQCAILPWGEIFYIIVNKKRRDAIRVDVGDTVDVVLTEDDSIYGLPMPDEFREVLNQDPEGDKLFHSLTAGKQRSILYLLGNIKNIDDRIHQALIIVDHMKENDGKIIDKKLYEELKRPMF